MLGSGINLIWCHFYSCLLSNWLFAEKFSNCSNSLNFEAKINCNTIKPNVPKWRKTCTGLKYDLLHFYGPQSHILSGDTFEGPCSSLHFTFLGRVSLMIVLVYFLCHTPKLCLTFFEIIFENPKVCLLLNSFDLSSSLLLLL